MKPKKLLLEFGKKNQLKFSNEEEFFEMLGMLCRKNSLTTITGKKKDGMIPYNADGIHLTAKDMPEGAQSFEKLPKDAFLYFGIHSFEIVCSPYETYPKAFASLIDTSAGGRVHCAEYVNYLIEHFGAYQHCAKSNGKKVTVKLPASEHMIDIIKDLGYGNFIASFEKGLSSS